MGSQLNHVKGDLRVRAQDSSPEGKKRAGDGTHLSTEPRGEGAPQVVPRSTEDERWDEGLGCKVSPPGRRRQVKPGGEEPQPSGIVATRVTLSGTHDALPHRASAVPGTGAGMPS